MGRSKTIDFSDLPSDILAKIPYSLRCAGDEHTISELPNDVQYIIREYLYTITQKMDYRAVYDFQPEVSVYGDFDVFKSKKDLVKHYLYNYLAIFIGSYPWDSNFGCNLKQQLQTKDASLRQTLVANEISLIINVIRNDTDSKITVTNLKIQKNTTDAHTEYSAVVDIEVDDDYITVVV